MTWLAYNRWPNWRSLYDLGEEPWGANNAKVGYDVGFDRPYAIYWNGFPAAFEPLTNGSGEFLMIELPLGFWLEKEGYDVTYISNVDTHADGKGLLRAKALLSVGHDEYWTKGCSTTCPRPATQASASRSSRATRLRPSRAAAQQRWSPQPRDAPIGDLPGEENLLGAKSYGVGFADWTCGLPEHWVFAGTNMKQGDRIAQLVGWEYHGLRWKATRVCGAFQGRCMAGTASAATAPTRRQFTPLRKAIRV